MNADITRALEDVDSFSAHYVATPGPDIPPERTAVLVVDMVNDFTDPDGAMPMPGAERLFEPINRLCDGARTTGGHVVWICAQYAPDDALFRKRTPHCLIGTRGTEVPAELVRRPDEKVVTKRRYSSFFGTDLDLWLREHGIERVVLCGLALNICVRSTAHDSFFLGYDTVVVTDGCQATSPREEASTLYDLATHFATVSTVGDVLGEWGLA